MLRLLIAGLLSFIAWSSALAERRVALVMGADDYAAVRPLRNAVKDAELVRDKLEQLGFIVSYEPNHTLERMRQALEDFKNDAAEADVAMVFFAGHGVEIAGNNRLLPTDANPASLESLTRTTLPLDEVRQLVSEVAPIGLIVLDACRNDPFGDGTGETRHVGRGAHSLWRNKQSDVRAGLGRMGRAENVLFAFSASPGQTASDGSKENSPFSTALAKYLDVDGLEIRSVLTLVQQEVYEVTRGKQLPYVESGLPDVFFARGQAQLPERERLLLAMAKITPSVREEIEAIASIRDMPLAPLFAVYLEGGLEHVGRDERRRQIIASADSYVSGRNRLELFTSEDEQVARLRRASADRFEEGAFDAAEELLEEAVRLDEQVNTTAATQAAPRAMSLAETYVQLGQNMRVRLRNAEAVKWLEKALQVYAGLDVGSLSPEAQRRRVETMSAVFELRLIIGDVTGADASVREAEALAEAYVTRGISDPKRHRLLARTQANRGRILKIRGAPELALRAFEEALTTTALDPSAKDDGAMADAHLNLGDMLFDLERLDEALSSYHTADHHYRRTLAVKNDPVVQQRALLSAERIANILAQKGDRDGARAAYAAILSALTSLSQTSPEDSQLALNVSSLHDRLGGSFLANGLAEAAVAEFRKALHIRERLTNLDDENVSWRRSVAISHHLIGDALMAASDMDGAVESYRKSVAIGEDIALRDPSNSEAQRELAIYKERLGTAEHARGDLPAGLRAIEEAVELKQQLSKYRPGDSELRDQIVLDIVKMGDYLVPAGKLDIALTSYESAADMIAQNAPRNDTRNRQLASILEKIGYLRGVLDDKGGAVAAYREAGNLLAASDIDGSDVAVQWARALISYELAGLGEEVASNRRKAAEIARMLREKNALSEDDSMIAEILERSAEN